MFAEALQKGINAGGVVAGFAIVIMALVGVVLVVFGLIGLIMTSVTEHLDDKEGAEDGVHGEDCGSQSGAQDA